MRPYIFIIAVWIERRIHACHDEAACSSDSAYRTESFIGNNILIHFILPSDIACTFILADWCHDAVHALIRHRGDALKGYTASLIKRHDLCLGQFGGRGHALFSVGTDIDRAGCCFRIEETVRIIRHFDSQRAVLTLEIIRSQRYRRIFSGKIQSGLLHGQRGRC